MLSEGVIWYSFLIVSAVGVLIKGWTWMRGTGHITSDARRIQFQYITALQAFSMGMAFQGAFVYQRYLDCHMDPQQISIIQMTFNVVSAIWGLFIGSVMAKFGHRHVIIASSFCLALHAMCRAIGGFWSFCLAGFLMGVSTAANRVVLEDWLMSRLHAFLDPKPIQARIQANSQFWRLIITLLLTPLSARVETRFGTRGVFVVSSLMSLIACVWIWFSLEAVRSERARPESHLRKIFSELRASPRFLALVFLDFCFTSFQLLYQPKWLLYLRESEKERLPKKSYISTTGNVVQTLGATLIDVVLPKLRWKPSLVVGLVAEAAAVLVIIVAFGSKNIVYAFYLGTWLCDAWTGTTTRIAKGELYPSDIRAHVMAMIRVPSALAVAGIMWKVSEPLHLLPIDLGFLTLASLGGIFV